ncbi:MAG: HPr-rel-A system PqqD family peptide chaperone [Halioglobus sp.]|nr:HPr-rel-A system PqqD family peptide chaperone [Halioglobus sp.]
MQWYAGTPGEFYDCDEATVVYFHPPSGNTHLITAFAAYLLRELARRPMTLEQLLQYAASATAADDYRSVSCALPGLLQDLVQLDILEQV